MQCTGFLACKSFFNAQANQIPLMNEPKNIGLSVIVHEKYQFQTIHDFDVTSGTLYDFI